MKKVLFAAVAAALVTPSSAAAQKHVSPVTINGNLTVGDVYNGYGVDIGIRDNDVLLGIRAPGSDEVVTEIDLSEADEGQALGYLFVIIGQGLIGDDQHRP